ncbi:MAG: XamI family restriction endonuclease [Proteobacteria bacterium]|nr:XamI family restriction endonuclease [Pseudomonadota bacterium]
MTEEKDQANAEKAKALYEKSLNDPVARARSWGDARSRADELITNTLSDSNNLMSISDALAQSGAHVRVLRSVMAPPVSQDTFGYLEASYRKQFEDSGKPYDTDSAKKIADRFLANRDTSITKWLDEGRGPTAAETKILVERAASVIASQRFLTTRRLFLSEQQKEGLAAALRDGGWTEVDAGVGGDDTKIAPGDFRRSLRPKKSTKPIEFACGLPGGKIAAIACNVTNDETNSAKRIDDIVVHVETWREWGKDFMTCAALLEGAVKPKHLKQLRKKNIEIFWSHDLAELINWLKKSPKRKH